MVELSRRNPRRVALKEGHNEVSNGPQSSSGSMLEVRYVRDHLCE